MPGLRIPGPPGGEAAKIAEKSPKKLPEGNLTELVRIKIASFGGKKVGVFGQAKKNFCEVVEYRAILRIEID